MRRAAPAGLLLALGCATDPATSNDALRDGGGDVAVDVAWDVGHDVGEGAPDVATDVTGDAAPDVLSDAATDVTGDVATDASLDAAPDVSLDAATDALSDVATDVTGDVATDGPLPAVPRFTDIAAAAGIVHTQWQRPPVCPWVPALLCEHAVFTGGVSVGDYDGDGWPDLFFTTLNPSPALYRNRHDGTFENVTALAGLSGIGPTAGAAFGDVEGDGDLDLYVTTFSGLKHHLFINAAGVFTDQAEARGAAVAGPDPHVGSGVAFGDYDSDGDLDLFASEWKADGVYGNREYNRLLQNHGDGTFEDVTAAAGIGFSSAGPLGHWGYTPLFADFDDDGHTDLALANDYRSSRLFWNDGDGTFTDGTIAAGVGTDEFGMGLAYADFDSDGRSDLLVTSIYNPLNLPNFTGNRLYRNLGHRLFEDATDAFGLRRTEWAWGVAAFDAENDGDLDVIVTNGVTEENAGTPVYLTDRSHLFLGGAVPFVEAPPESGIVDTRQGRGLAVVDMDRDGDLDVIIATYLGRALVYRNDAGSARHWLELALHARSGRTAYGARVTLTPAGGGAVQRRELTAGGHFLSQDEPLVHFGLDREGGPVAEVRVRFPGANSDVVLTDVAPDQRLDVNEP